MFYANIDIACGYVQRGARTRGFCLLLGRVEDKLRLYTYAPSMPIDREGRCIFFYAMASAEAALLAEFPHMLALLDEAPQVEVLYDRMEALCRSADEERQKALGISRLFAELLYICRAILLTESAERTREVGGVVAAARDHIDAHYDEKYSLEALAAKVHVSPGHLHTLFRSHLGLTPLDYLMEKRIEVAKRLMASGEDTMAEISKKVGFSSQSYFGKVFRRRTGMTPAKYRKQMYS